MWNLVCNSALLLLLHTSWYDCVHIFTADQNGIKEFFVFPEKKRDSQRICICEVENWLLGLCGEIIRERMEMYDIITDHYKVFALLMSVFLSCPLSLSSSASPHQ